jgi:putative tryptophan/tyrosine transport system substrate-binding protein
VIGYLSGGLDAGPAVTAFHQGLGELGYVDGRNVEVLHRSAEGLYERLPELARDLVNRRVALILASVPVLAVLAAKSATATTPIVFVNGIDPVDLGLVASLNRPNGNITGVNFLVTLLTAKRLEVLNQLALAATSVGFLVNPTNLATEAQIREAESAARSLGVRLVILHASTPGDIEAAFTSLAGRQISALLGGADALLFSRRRQIAALAIRHAIPAIYEFRMEPIWQMRIALPEPMPAASSRAKRLPTCQCSNPRRSSSSSTSRLPRRWILPFRQTCSSAPTR